jgi:antirestriction protein
MLGILVCLLLLAFGEAILSGWTMTQGAAWTILLLLLITGFIVWAAVCIGILSRSPERRWLGGVLEKTEPRLLDRLNTLLFLEKQRPEPRLQSFAARIASQTQTVLGEQAAPRPFQSTAALIWFATFIAVLAGTVWFYAGTSPWSRLLVAGRSRSTPIPAGDRAFELALPTNNVESVQPWGEVRITEPGADLQVTKVDVVPLQIEAAANEPLKTVGWFSAVNGAEEVPHDLPPPTEPRYALYQPIVYLDELHLADWDVMTYYAKAHTDKTQAFASEVYFLEVRPFREDILKLPGGQRGQAYATLNEISILISRQQHIIRQTHQHIQRPPEFENIRAQDRKKLSAAEGDLSDSTEHLYARMAAEMENQPIGEALDNLAKAERSLAEASRLLAANSLNEVPNPERRALSELVAARKMFQKAVSEHPDAFDQGKEQTASPATDSKRLEQMAEFRNEAKAAQEFVQKMVEQQRNLQQQARTTSQTDYGPLAGQEQHLQQALRDFSTQHPEPFKEAHSEIGEAQKAMGDAAQSLEKRRAEARSATQEATHALEKLSQAVQNQAATQQLADAYRLKRMLDQQIRTLDQGANSGTNVSSPELQKAARDARETIDQLGKTAEQEPTREAFGQPLRDALSGQNRMDIEVKLRQLQQAQEDGEIQQRAAAAGEKLAQVSKAFSESQPRALQQARKTDSLQPGGQSAFNDGLAGGSPPFT